MTQYGSVNSGVVTTDHSPASPMNSVHQSDAAVPSFVTLTGSEQYAPAHVLYAVGHRSPHDASSSPGPGDTSPRAPPSQLSPATGSPHWFAHSPSPPLPSRIGDIVAPGELSPAHASALQQQFQQFSMVTCMFQTLFINIVFICEVTTVLCILENNHHPSVLWHCWLGHPTRKIVSKMTYNGSSGMLNRTIPYIPLFDSTRYRWLQWNTNHAIIWCWTSRK